MFAVDGACEFAFVVANRFRKISAAGKRVAHQKERGGFLGTVRNGFINHAVQEVDGAIETEQWIMRDAVSAFLREADFAGHPLAQIEHEAIVVGLEFGGLGGQLVGQIGVVVEELRARVDHRFRAQRGDVIGVAGQGCREVFDSLGQGEAALARVGFAIEIEQEAASDLEGGFGILRMGNAFAFQLKAGFSGLAVAQEHERVCQRAGLLLERLLGEEDDG